MHGPRFDVGDQVEQRVGLLVDDASLAPDVLRHKCAPGHGAWTRVREVVRGVPSPAARRMLIAPLGAIQARPGCAWDGSTSWYSTMC